MKLKKVVQDCNFREQLSYFKLRDKNVHKMKKHMVHVLSNLNVVICHAFIKDQVMMPLDNPPKFLVDLGDDLSNQYNVPQ